MSLSYRLGSNALFERPNEETKQPERVVFLSVEGTTTEVCYFKYVERNREALGIKAIVHLEVLRRHDTKSDPESVLELLEEYVQFRNEGKFEKEINSLNLQQYDSEFIKTYLEDPDKISVRKRRCFEAALREEHMDLLYLDFLSRFHGERDTFGIVIDRDEKSHPFSQMQKIIAKCEEKKYSYYITNPCFEFWQLLHVSDAAIEYKECLPEILKNDLDENGNTFVSNLLHEKTGERKRITAKSFEKNYLPHIDLAIERAKKFAPPQHLLMELGSNLGSLFQELRNP